MTTSFRTLRLLAVAAVLLAAGVAAPRFLTYSPYARFGARLDFHTPGGVARVEEIVGPPALGLLEEGDLLRVVDGRPGTQEEFKRRPTSMLPRGPIQLTIERAGELQELTLPPVRLSLWQRVRLRAFSLAAVVAAPVIAFLLVWRRPDLAAAWTFLWFAVLQGLGVVWVYFRVPPGEPGPLARAYLDVYGALCWWYPAAFLHFMTVFPRPRWRAAGLARSAWFWLVVLAYATPPVLWLLGQRAAEPGAPSAMWFQAVAMALGTLALVDRYAWPRRDAPPARPGERVLALAVVLTLALAAALAVATSHPRFQELWYAFPPLRLAVTSVDIAVLVAPLLIAFLIANDPVFDPRRIAVRTVPFALLSVVLAGVYLGLVVVSQRLFAAATGEESMAFNVVAALVVAFAFAPLWSRTQHALDRLFGRDPQVLRLALDQAGRALLGALDPDEVRRSVRDSLARGLKREAALEWPEGAPPRLAAGEELPDHARRAVENLLLQAGIRLENLALQEHRAAAERQAIELREAATRAELRALQAQVQPHFLFNALNALAYLIETDPPSAQRYSERLADMLRYTVEAGNRPVALLSDEIGFVEDYLGVARERYETTLEFAYRGPRELLSLAVPPLLLQPLVENSLKHGCAPDPRPGPADGGYPGGGPAGDPPGMHLELTAAQEDGFVALTFSDDGVATSNGSAGLGVGLTNLEQRLRRFAGAGATMEAGARRDADGAPARGFTVRLRWPVTKGDTP
jgi:hypothetical protein